MKQAIVVRKDLKMSCGKIAGQVAHASLRAYRVTPKMERDNWIYNYNEVKVVLKVQSEEELNKIIKRCEESDVPYSLVFDAGKTQIEPHTLTALGIGPDEDKVINDIVGDLKLL